jgi:hypothetical protein
MHFNKLARFCDPMSFPGALKSIMLIRGAYAKASQFITATERLGTRQMVNENK